MRHYFIQPLINSFFNGALVLVPLLFVAHLFKLQFPVINKATLVQAVNCTLLLGAVLYVLVVPIEFFISYYYGGEYEQYTMGNRLFSSFWIDFLILVIFPNVLLPQILWVKKFRQTIISSVIIVSIWLFLYLLTDLFATHRGWYIVIGLTWFYYLKQALIYTAIVGAMYFILARKRVLR